MTLGGGQETPRHPMGVVAQRTGLTPHALRAWERRYGAVTPARSEGGQRIYSDADVRRLRLLKRLTEAGRPIGMVARLGTGELTRLAREDSGAEGLWVPGAVGGGADRHLAACMRAAERMDGSALREELLRSVVQLEVGLVVRGVLTPLLKQVGDMWAEGRLRPAQEHVVSAAVRQVLDWLLVRFETEPGAPVLVVTTPSGELHEFGAMLAAVEAADVGWRVVYLGPSLPPEEVVLAVERTRARVVGLSVVAGPGSEAGRDGGTLSPVERQLTDLAELLPGEVVVVVGGSGSAGLRLPERVLVEDLDSFRNTLVGAGTSRYVG